MIIKWTILNIVILLFFQTFAQSPGTARRIILDCNKKPLRFVLEDIKAQSGINFIYRDALVDNINITYRIESSLPEKAVKKILKEHNLSYKIYDQNYFVLFRKKEATQNNYKAVILKKDIPDTNAGILSKPVLISSLSPVYPQEALKNRIEGKVAIKFYVTKDGNVTDTFIESTSGSDILDSATSEYVRKLKFTPAQTNGTPRNVWMTMSFEYLFQDK